MTNRGISEGVQNFIFKYIDSVELLEVLLFIQKNSDRSWTAAALSAELRGNASSVTRRLEKLASIGLAEPDKNSEITSYRYASVNPEQAALMVELADVYRIRPSRLIELIFSPAKKARSFADAFMVSRPTQRNGNDDGNDPS